MSASIVVGPLLGYEDGGTYSVCVLTDGGTTPTALRVADAKGGTASHPFVQKARVGANVFWRAEFKPVDGPKAADWSYEVRAGTRTLADRHARSSWSFHVPATSEHPLIAYGSCNGFSSAKLVADAKDPYCLWKKMGKLHKKNPYALLLMGGDQVYADEIWESNRCPELRKWSELSEKEQLKFKVTPAMRAEINAFYDWLYTDRWKNPEMSLMLASIPTVMMWDDHDIFDGWGSYPEEKQTCDVYQTIFAAASRCFDVLQMRCTTSGRLSSDGSHRSLGIRFRDYDLLVLDNRSERTIRQIMSDTHWNDVKTWLARVAVSPAANLLVMTAVPVVYRSFALVEKALTSSPWEIESTDDVLDHWSATKHQTERMKLVMLLLKFLSDQKAAGRTISAVLLSGDVHVGALGQIWEARRDVGLTQIVSSAIVHPPPSRFEWAGLCLATSDTPEQLGEGDAVAEMLTPLGADRYLRSRNFASLQNGTDDLLWINWICEDDDIRASFAVSR